MSININKLFSLQQCTCAPFLHILAHTYFQTLGSCQSNRWEVSHLFEFAFLLLMGHLNIFIWVCLFLLNWPVNKRAGLDPTHSIGSIQPMITLALWAPPWYSGLNEFLGGLSVACNFIDSNIGKISGDIWLGAACCRDQTMAPRSIFHLCFMGLLSWWWLPSQGLDPPAAGAPAWVLYAGFWRKFSALLPD